MEEEIENNSRTFKDYLEKDNREKYAIVITKSQYAIKQRFIAHEDMVKYLINKTRPDIETDEWGNSINGSEVYNDSNIVMVGYRNYALIEIPRREMLSPEQFNCLKEILLEIKKYNEKIDKQGYGEKFELNVYGNYDLKLDYDNYQDKVDELIEKLSVFVKEPSFISPEVIIGKPLISNKKSEIASSKTQEEIDGEKMLNELYEYFHSAEEEKSKVRGFSTISIIAVITSLITIGILVLGIILTF